MTVKDFAEISGSAVLAGDDEMLSRDISGGCYIGDLLSRVISRAKPGGVWITIMTNVNVAAVALLADVSCIVLCESVEPDDELTEKAKQENIPLLASPLDAFELAMLYSGLAK